MADSIGAVEGYWGIFRHYLMGCFLSLHGARNNSHVFLIYYCSIGYEKSIACRQIGAWKREKLLKEFHVIFTIPHKSIDKVPF